MRPIDADALIKEYEEILKTLADFCVLERMMCREVIRALQNAPTIEPSDDVVNREKLINTIVGTESKVAKNSPYDAEWFTRMADRQNEIIDIIREFPSEVRPEGEWLDGEGDKVEIDDDGVTEDSCWCSVCGEWLVASDEYPTMGNFCPHCGADMRGEK